MKRILLLLLFPFCLCAQTYEWVKFPLVQMQYNPDLIGYSVANDQSGNLYYAGFKDEPFIYNDILGNQFINKYNPDGELFFSKTISGHVQTHNLIVDSQHNIIVALKFVNQMTIEDVEFSTVSQGEQHVLAKFNSNGELLWYDWLQPADMGGNWYNEIAEFRALTLDADDNIIIGYSDFFKSFLKKYSPDGTPGMQVEQVSVRRISSVSVDEQGNWYAAGSCIDFNAQFAGVPLDTEFPYTVYISKYNPQGIFQWVKVIEDITCSEPHVVTKSENEIYFASALFGTLVIDGITLESEAATDFYLLKLNSEGAVQWARDTPANGRFILGDRNFLNLDSQGNVYVSGQSASQIDWGNGINTNISLFTNNGILVKYDPEGIVTAAKTVSSDYSSVNGLSINMQGDVFVAGMSMGSADFDSIHHEPEQPDNHYPFLAKINMAPLGTNDIGSDVIMVYPNPATSQLFVSGIDRSSQVKIYNTIGQKVLETVSDFQKPIDVSVLTQGVYMLKINESETIRFIKK
ncbi:T9SS type A sorting domain-containing protein [Flavobacterium silvaticum]|uniref:T9SS type A sorting domain-containing protein n=1 Tax=Flavobacterium silvaticum TaxID=1852020 RepID=A0A972JIJ4_9FLAO|nr:T9SS type A sorting domain-containing protein [Flavobacterium silvaticum]NMH29100.1 T9SS type A sorting domain-containing protein [Flavobacterium silvaticum]